MESPTQEEMLSMSSSMKDIGEKGGKMMVHFEAKVRPPLSHRASSARSVSRQIER